MDGDGVVRASKSDPNSLSELVALLRFMAKGSCAVEPPVRAERINQYNLPAPYLGHYQRPHTYLGSRLRRTPPSLLAREYRNPDGVSAKFCVLSFFFSERSSNPDAMDSRVKWNIALG